jgi:hypothetical protein
MLSTIVTLTNTASSTTAVSSAISITSALSVGIGGALIAILLIVLLSSRELIGASSKTSKKILSSLDSAIVPLIVVFALTVVFKVIEVTNGL